MFILLHLIGWSYKVGWTIFQKEKQLLHFKRNIIYGVSLVGGSMIFSDFVRNWARYTKALRCKTQHFRKLKKNKKYCQKTQQQKEAKTFKETHFHICKMLFSLSQRVFSVLLCFLKRCCVLKTLMCFSELMLCFLFCCYVLQSLCKNSY